MNPDQQERTWTPAWAIADIPTEMLKAHIECELSEPSLGKKRSD